MAVRNQKKLYEITKNLRNWMVPKQTLDLKIKLTTWLTVKRKQTKLGFLDCTQYCWTQFNIIKQQRLVKFGWILNTVSLNKSQLTVFIYYLNIIQTNQCLNAWAPDSDANARSLCFLLITNSWSLFFTSLDETGHKRKKQFSIISYTNYAKISVPLDNSASYSSSILLYCIPNRNQYFFRRKKTAKLIHQCLQCC